MLFLSVFLVCCCQGVGSRGEAGCCGTDVGALGAAHGILGEGAAHSAQAIAAAALQGHVGANTSERRKHAIMSYCTGRSPWAAGTACYCSAAIVCSAGLTPRDVLHWNQQLCTALNRACGGSVCTQVCYLYHMHE